MDLINTILTVAVIVILVKIVYNLISNRKVKEEQSKEALRKFKDAESLLSKQESKVKILKRKLKDNLGVREDLDLQDIKKEVKKAITKKETPKKRVSKKSSTTKKQSSKKEPASVQDKVKTTRKSRVKRSDSINKPS